MIPTDSQKCVPLSLRMAFVVLAVAVFAWGLHYKLSLYNTEPSHNLSVAKLIQGERPGKKIAAILVRNRTMCSQLAIERIVQTLVRAVAVPEFRAADEPLTSFALFVAPPRFVRPPPQRF